MDKLRNKPYIVVLLVYGAVKVIRVAYAARDLVRSLVRREL